MSDEQHRDQQHHDEQHHDEQRIELSVTREAIEEIRRKGGVAAIDLIPPLG